MGGLSQTPSGLVNERGWRRDPRSSSPFTIICLPTEPNRGKLQKLLVMNEDHATQPTSQALAPQGPGWGLGGVWSERPLAVGHIRPGF